MLCLYVLAQYPFLFGFCVALCWSVLVCLSRVYMGMHSVLVSIMNSTQLRKKSFMANNE